MPPKHSENERLLRLEKKQARRQKQREANAGRAEKMRKARIEVEKTNEFDPEPPKSLRKNIPEIHIGCSGWFYWDWKEIFYPHSLPMSDWFKYYTKHFKTVELNAPFYSWPTIATVKSWIKQIGKKPFVYTVKVCELITHIKQFHGTKELVLDFGYIADLLGPNMGCLLFQLPPKFQYTEARLKNILSQLDIRRRNILEFRHKSWWNEKVYEAFRKKGTIFCSVSAPNLPDKLIKTSDDIYVRFHGTKKWYRHDYSKEELKVWSERICSSGAKKMWIYFNNDYGGYAIKNARELGRQLSKYKSQKL